MRSPRLITRTLAVAAVLLFLPVTFAHAQVPAIEREALIALYNSTDGDNWVDKTNWLEPEGTECFWYGVICSGGHVVRLGLSSNQLRGSIPPELGNLPILEKLVLSHNELIGIIPPELENLSSMTWLDLGDNQLSGEVPPELGNLSNLKNLLLSYNQLTGNIPPGLGNLTGLGQLDLRHNHLIGGIPHELGNLSHLAELTLDTNELSGNIPTELGNLSNLYYLWLYGNNLSGDIPPELGNLTVLWFLYLNSNQLTGAIPPELGNLSNLLDLHLNNNQLIGNIPLELGNLSSLMWLDLSDNQLDGEIPPELGNLANLAILIIHSNRLTGGIPSELGNLIGLVNLILHSNQLSGSIPPELGNLSSLNYLYLNSNKLSGAVPSELGNLTSLFENKGLDLCWNAVHSDNTGLISFLNTKQDGGDWQSTQTIAPENVAVESIGDHTVWLSWNAVSYQNDPGGYEVFSSPAGAGVWLSGGWTASKLDTTFPVTGLNPATSYDFSVATYTDPHVNNLNLVTSDLSPEVTVTTSDTGCAQPTIEISIGDVITLTVVGDWDSYLWSTGETTPSIVIDAPSDQWYWVTVTGAGPCEETAAILGPGTVVFGDGFESADTSAWSSVSP